MGRQDKQNRGQRVNLFNREWNDREDHWFRQDDGHFVLGVMLLIAGILLFLNSFGIVSWNVWDYVWQFWPVLLIIWGVQAILGHNVFSRFIVGIFALVVIGFVVLFSVVKVNPEYRHKMSPQMNNMLNQMDKYNMRGFTDER